MYVFRLSHRAGYTGARGESRTASLSSPCRLSKRLRLPLCAPPARFNAASARSSISKAAEGSGSSVAAIISCEKRRVRGNTFRSKIASGKSPRCAEPSFSRFPIQIRRGCRCFFYTKLAPAYSILKIPPAFHRILLAGRIKLVRDYRMLRGTATFYFDAPSSRSRVLFTQLRSTFVPPLAGTKAAALAFPSLRQIFRS